MTSKRYVVVISVLGGTGKSSRCARFTNGNFQKKYDPTIEDSYNTNVVINETLSVPIELIDTAGQNEYTTMTRDNISKAEVLMIAVSVIDHTSLQKVYEYKKYLVQPQELGRGAVPIVLVATKCDVFPEALWNTSLSEIEKAAAVVKAENMQNIFITSAMNGRGVDECFIYAVECAYRYCNPPIPVHKSARGHSFGILGRRNSVSYINGDIALDSPNSSSALSSRSENGSLNSVRSTPSERSGCVLI